jgi:hypothetical protein
MWGLAITVAVISILVFVGIIRLLRNPTIVLWGKIIDVDIRYYSGATTVTFELPSKEQLTLEFETGTNLGCVHLDEECFHGKAKDLEKILKKDHYLMVRTRDRRGKVRHVDRLVLKAEYH